MMKFWKKEVVIAEIIRKNLLLFPNSNRRRLRRIIKLFFKELILYYIIFDILYIYAYVYSHFYIFKTL